MQADCGSNPSCTSLEGLPQSALDGLGVIKKGCDEKAVFYNGTNSSCNLTVTGGAEEAGHKTHGPGRAIVDIEDTDFVNEYIWGTIGRRNSIPYEWYQGSDGYWYFFEDRRSHWHVCFASPCYITDLGQ